jgi:hypothetical protein
MKTLVIAAFALFVASASAQFKEDPFAAESVKAGFVDESSGSVFSWFDASKFDMNHTYSMSYTGFAGGGFALGMYTNSMRYQAAENLSVEADVSLVHSPYSSESFGTNFQEQIGGLYLSRAQINYRPWENTELFVQYRNMPFGGSYYRDSYFNRAGRGFYPY